MKCECLTRYFNRKDDFDDLFISCWRMYARIEPNTPDTFRRSYAGDVYNSAIYAKRVAPSLEVGFRPRWVPMRSVTICWPWEAGVLIPRRFARSSEYPRPYAITLDENGERSFVYWRSQSAARGMMNLVANAGGLMPSQFRITSISLGLPWVF